MKRRCCVEFINHATIKITAFNYQKTYDLKKIHKQDQQIDLITAKVISRTDISQWKLEIDWGEGTLSDPFKLFIIGETRAGIYEVVARFSLSMGREQTFEIDLP